jgi:hypothetical protein
LKPLGKPAEAPDAMIRPSPAAFSAVERMRETVPESRQPNTWSGRLVCASYQAAGRWNECSLGMGPSSGSGAAKVAHLPQSNLVERALRRTLGTPFSNRETTLRSTSPRTNTVPSSQRIWSGHSAARLNATQGEQFPQGRSA